MGYDRDMYKRRNDVERAIAATRRLPSDLLPLPRSFYAMFLGFLSFVLVAEVWWRTKRE
jgi:hypothetical protein